MVRLVFRRYTQIRRSICTSESLRASTSVSAGFTLFRHSSPSFGSQQIRSYSNLPESRIGRSMMRAAWNGFSPQSSLTTTFTFIAPTGFHHPETCAHVRLLGPCFKTGRMEPYDRQHLGRVVSTHRASDRPQFGRTGVPSATFDMPDRSHEWPAKHASTPRATVAVELCEPRGLTTHCANSKFTFLASLSPVDNRRWRSPARSAPLAHRTRARLVHVNRERARREARATESGWANC